MVSSKKGEFKIQKGDKIEKLLFYHKKATTLVKVLLNFRI